MNTLYINIKAAKPQRSSHFRQLKMALYLKQEKLENKQETLFDAKTHRHSYDSYAPLWKL